MAVAGLPTSATAYVIASGLIHLVSNALVLRMYRSGDLGETYPIARGSSPALIALGGSLFAAERMDALGSIGISLVCVGIFMLALAKGRLHAMNLPSTLATGVSIAAYSIVDGIGVRASGNWVAYTGGMFAFYLLVPLWHLVGRERVIFVMPLAEAAKAASGGLISLAAYGAIIWAMQGNTMGAVSALRETSVVFAALLGAVFLNERLTGLRIAACCIIAIGAACVGWRS